ncbi:MAG: hypothetical protein DRO11_08860 [Methanobacteriota archaeon]|nr:MAG: hypothetical protein DRO11_08860 [Euryarchaeota archaeon]
MDIEDQVVSLELAKKLKKIGLGCNEYQPETEWRWYRLEPDGWCVGASTLRVAEEWYPAFTVAEMMEELPAVVETKAGRYRLTIEKYEPRWYVSYIGTAGDALETALNKKLADALAEMLIWLKKECKEVKE